MVKYSQMLRQLRNTREKHNEEKFLNLIEQL